MTKPLSIREFKGMRTDLEKGDLGPEWFSDVVNFDFGSGRGIDRVLYPGEVVTLAAEPDGFYEYRYLDDSNVLQTQQICAAGGTIYKEWKTTPVSVYTGMNTGPVQFEVYQDKLWIVNGQDYPVVYDGVYAWQAGAPRAIDALVAGNLNGAYYYAITYVTAAGEFVIDTVSNMITVTNSQMTLAIPVGWSDVTSRKIYRTAAGGTTLKLVATVANNTDIEYTDNILDASLGADIAQSNKPYTRSRWITTSANRLFLSGDPKYPTQMYYTETGLLVADTDNFADITNVGGDNTSITGMIRDYDKIILGSEKDLYIADGFADPVTVTPTRANIGVLSGYSMQSVPNEDGFPGGILFISTSFDMRLFSGNFAEDLATSLDNLATNNWSAVLENSMNYDMESVTNTDIRAAFYRYKYYLIVNGQIWVFDLRKNGRWGKYTFTSSDQLRIPKTIGVSDDLLYFGYDTGLVDLHNQYIQYNDSSDLTAYLKTGKLLKSDSLKKFKRLTVYYAVTSQSYITLKITIDGNPTIIQEIDISNNRGSWDSSRFLDTYDTDYQDDFFVYEIEMNGHWLEFEIETEKMFLFRGYDLSYRPL